MFQILGLLWFSIDELTPLTEFQPKSTIYDPEIVIFLNLLEHMSPYVSNIYYTSPHGIKDSSKRD